MKVKLVFNSSMERVNGSFANKFKTIDKTFDVFIDDIYVGELITGYEKFIFNEDWVSPDKRTKEIEKAFNNTRGLRDYLMKHTDKIDSIVRQKTFRR